MKSVFVAAVVTLSIVITSSADAATRRNGVCIYTDKAGNETRFLAAKTKAACEGQRASNIIIGKRGGSNIRWKTL
jgi:hypothetical protein